MTTQTKQHIPWYLWPFAAIWKLLAVIVEMTGRFVAMVLGFVRRPRQPDDHRRNCGRPIGDYWAASFTARDILMKAR